MKSALRKGPSIVAFRGWQEACLVGRSLTRGWRRLERATDRRATRASALARWLDRSAEGMRIVLPQHVAALHQFAGEEEAWRNRLREQVEAMRDGEILVFDTRVRFSGSQLPWHTDWRVEYEFPRQCFADYRFFGIPKAVPYDVKFPWELSRFGFAVPLALAAVVLGDNRYRDLLTAWIEDWRRANPLAHSVNWHPMECAMRGINVALAAEVLIAAGQLEARHARLFLPFLAAQGEFLWRTLERTDVNNNHFFSNAAGLAVIGGTLVRSGYPAARRWMRFGLQWVARETMLEFYADGVNFEMSVGYHRLVTELGLLASIVADRFGVPLPPEARDRLREAWRYTAAYVRPDGWAPNVGDNDSARALPFDSLPSRNHSTLTALGAAYFDESPVGTQSVASASVPILLGVNTRPANVRVPLSRGQWRHFPNGGVVVVRTNDDHYLFADYGPVGLAGRGGHGHNDIFSFELSLHGRAVVVDPGCPIYSGNLDLHRQFCSSSMHNGLTIDDREVAPLLGPWRTGDDAHPLDVSAVADGDVLVIRGEHRGYRRLPDPIDHRRVTRFDLRSGVLHVEDVLEGTGSHRADRWLHLARGIEIQQSGDSSMVLSDERGGIAVLRWDKASHSTTAPGRISDGYSLLTDALVIRLTTATCGNTSLWYSIQPVPRDGAASGLPLTVIPPCTPDGAE